MSTAPLKLAKDPLPQIRWVRWPNLEDWLTTAHTTKFVIHDEFPVKRIDVVRSKKNLARLDSPFVPENILAMHTLINELRSIELPYLCGTRVKPSSTGEDIMLADGNNRLKVVLDRGLTTVGLYELIDVGPSVFDLIARTANTQVGASSRNETRLEHAAWYYRSMLGRVTVREAAQTCRVNEGTLQKVVGAYKLQFKLSPFGTLPVVGYDKLPMSVLARMVPIDNAGNDAVLRAAAEGMVSIPRVSDKHAKQLMKHYRAANPRTEAGQIAAIVAYIASVHAALEAAAAPARLVRAASRQIRAMQEATRFLNSLEREFQDAGLRDVIVDPARRPEYLKHLRDIKEWIVKIEKGA